MSQPAGVGLLTATVFMLTVEDQTRFAKSLDAGAFLGTVPRKDRSGASDKQVSITKAGDPFVRKLLVNAANDANKEAQEQRATAELRPSTRAHKLAAAMAAPERIGPQHPPGTQRRP